MNSIKYFFSIIFFFFSTVLFAEKKSLTLEEAVQLGLQNSKSLHSSKMKLIVAESKRDETNASRLPSVKFTGAYTRLSEVPSASFPNPLAALNPSLPKSFEISPSVFDNYLTKLSVTQPLYLGNKISSATEIAEYSSQATNEDFNKDKKELVFAIQQSYWNLFKAMEFKNLIDENVVQVQAHLTDVQNFLKQGMATTNDVLKVQVQLSNIQLLQVDAKNNVQLAMIALNNVMGISLDTELELSTNIKHEPKTFSDVNSLVEKAMQNRPELRAMDFRVKASESAVTLAKSNWYPQVFLMGNYNYARPNQRIFPTKDEFKNTWDVGIGVSFDVWNWGQTSQQTAQAKAQLEQANDGVGLLKDGITLEVTQNYLNVQQSKERISVAEQGVQQAEENYRVTNEKFKQGLALNSDLLDAEVALLQAKTNLTQAQIDYEISEARLEKAIGEK
ncbi:MAG: TolC family protein [Ignavibacteriales bacterium]|nr:TolC family protein [Ignavibacteriales bacterium]